MATETIETEAQLDERLSLPTPLCRVGLLEGRWCLNLKEELSPGRSEEIDRICRSYPEMRDAAFVKEHLQEWLG